MTQGRRPLKPKPEVKQDVNLMNLIERFHSEEKCRQYLEGLRWPNGVRCLRCKSPKVIQLYARKLYECESCSYQFSVIVGTMFESTHLPLRKWFIAIYLMCESKKGISANQLKRTLNVAYRTSWYLCHRIRAAMETTRDSDAVKLLDGIIEMDETFVGGEPWYVIYGIVLFPAMMSLGIFFVLDTVLKTSTFKLTSLFTIGSINLYYWYSLPVLLTQIGDGLGYLPWASAMVGIGDELSIAVRFVLLSTLGVLSVIWLIRALEKERRFAENYMTASLYLKGNSPKQSVRG